MYISLLLAVIMQSTGSIWVYLGFQLNRDYIESQLCINRFDAIPVCKGSCYLEVKIKEENSNTDAHIIIKLLEIAMILPVVEHQDKKINYVPALDIVFAPLS